MYTLSVQCLSTRIQGELHAGRTVACWKQEAEPDHMTSADPTNHRVGSSLLQVKGLEHWGLGSRGSVSTWETSTQQTSGSSALQIKEDLE